MKISMLTFSVVQQHVQQRQSCHL